MAVLEIVKAGDPVLKQIAAPIEKVDSKLRKLMDSMAETMYKADGVGLAAPQIGQSIRCVVIDVQDEHGLLELVNPVITAREGCATDSEGCLSVPGKYGLVKRPYYAKVRAQDRHGEWFECEGEELIARCFCHELDHLDGIVYTEVMERFLTEEELAGDED